MIRSNSPRRPFATWDSQFHVLHSLRETNNFPPPSPYKFPPSNAVVRRFSKVKKASNPTTISKVLISLPDDLSSETSNPQATVAPIFGSPSISRQLRPLSGDETTSNSMPTPPTAAEALKPSKDESNTESMTVVAPSLSSIYFTNDPPDYFNLQNSKEGSRFNECRVHSSGNGGAQDLALIPPRPPRNRGAASSNDTSTSLSARPAGRPSPRTTSSQTPVPYNAYFARVTMTHTTRGISSPLSPRPPYRLGSLGPTAPPLPVASSSSPSSPLSPPIPLPRPPLPLSPVPSDSRETRIRSVVDPHESTLSVALQLRDAGHAVRRSATAPTNLTGGMGSGSGGESADPILNGASRREEGMRQYSASRWFLREQGEDGKREEGLSGVTCINNSHALSSSLKDEDYKPNNSDNYTSNYKYSTTSYFNSYNIKTNDNATTNGNLAYHFSPQGGNAKNPAMSVSEFNFRPQPLPPSSVSLSAPWRFDSLPYDLAASSDSATRGNAQFHAAYMPYTVVHKSTSPPSSESYGSPYWPSVVAAAEAICRRKASRKMAILRNAEAAAAAKEEGGKSKKEEGERRQKEEGERRKREEGGRKKEEIRESEQGSHEGKEPKEKQDQSFQRQAEEKRSLSEESEGRRTERE